MQKVSRDNIKYLMELALINPSKDKGQNFLIDEKIAQNIVNLLQNSPNSSIIEIGPGLGSLTYHLENKSSNLSIIDIDKRIVDYLTLEVKSTTKIIYQDALKYDFKNYEYIISNIPYNITTDLINHLLISGINCKQFVFMCQKENFAHFYNVSGSEYGPTSVLIHLLGNIKKAFDVKPGSFVPAPKCVSTVFTIDMIDGVDKEAATKAYKLASSLFLNRRKTILNNLSRIYGKDSASRYLNEASIAYNLRPEDISPEEYLKLHNIISRVI